MTYLVICKHCQKSKKSKDPATIYCSFVCQQKRQHVDYIERWKTGLETGITGKTCTSKHIKRYIWEKYKARCSKCGWAEKHPIDDRIPLELEHIDGNYRNNEEENLDLLCPNCHSLTSTFRNRNKGRSTRIRKPG